MHELYEVDENGNKIGLWHLYYADDTKIELHVFYEKNASGKSSSVWKKRFDRSGNITYITIRDRNNTMHVLEYSSYKKLFLE